ncbi:PD-(D/E)XK nuclease family protein [Fontisphaera persica]|uniref:PD-(D/E)XK nuclease family protein n=1 Tax=Fontisphaera persica TaxID=2974023 RepID=UPI0024C0B393|nr:PD-(D/E)XK nuclease family protein [Fontisphaera persica]WCJ58426.1 PD-(D/E)XK nuclease family protein [Fontisphaera persica]
MTAPHRSIRFLLGPAGSGKTWRCVEEIRQELLRDPAGPPLILLAPRQATFQLERQLLAEGKLQGYTRLSILSFARLATHLLDHLGTGRPRLLSEEGRVMVLRTLLKKHGGSLRIFHSTAQLPGFAAELSRWLRELQQQQITPQTLSEAADRLKHLPGLAAKLQDTALLYQAFQQWLEDHALEDADGLLGLATKRLRQVYQQGTPLGIGGLWMDGFAELTPQEVTFLEALALHCRQMTLAFCVENKPDECVNNKPGVDNKPAEALPDWHPQAVVARTLQRCAEQLSALEGAVLQYEVLQRDTERSRFARAPALAHLECHWAELMPPPFAETTPAVRLVACAHPEAEVTFAAREIVRHVRGGGRFREVAVLVRRLETHAALLKRIFRQYEIPFFLDQRESMAHHPLAELTRYTLRVMAHGWQNADWLGALKTGLAPIEPEELDELENLVLELGLDGERWLQSWGEAASPAAEWESCRSKLVDPFKALRKTLTSSPGGVNGEQIACGLRQFFDDLKVAETLQQWAQNQTPGAGDLPPAAHLTVWEAVEEWLDTLELALGDHALPLAEWLPILESGLSQLSVGVIPPALDQVLVGAVDRSRQPDLHTLFILGMNEGLFPAPPTLPALLSEEERALLEHEGKLILGLGAMVHQGAERYLGYIACTRPAVCLVVCRAEAQAAGQPLNPSLFYLRLQQMFPQVQEEAFTGEFPPKDSVHWSELLPELVRAQALPEELLAQVPLQVRRLKQYAPDEQLSAGVVDKLFKKQLVTSISALETYAACPFRYFVERVLRAQERPLFAVDAARRGSFLHQVLAAFHQAVVRQGRRWRDLSPEEAQQLLEQVAQEVSEQFQYGVMKANVRHDFARELLVERLKAYVAQAVQWMSVYQLNPWKVEVAFGMEGDPQDNQKLPAWCLPLDDGSKLCLVGRIDRVDVCQPTKDSPPLAVVIDYKSSEKKMDATKLHHGCDLQLMAYLNVVCSLPDLARAAQANALQPVGAFYLSLTASESGVSQREKAWGEISPRDQFPHHGRFDQAHWEVLDAKAKQGKATGPVAFGFKKGASTPSGADVLASQDWQNLLQQNQQHLRAFGSRILSGDMRVSPCQIKKKKACEYCPCREVCRFDPWHHEFRRLAAPPKSGNTAEEATGA